MLRRIYSLHTVSTSPKWCPGARRLSTGPLQARVNAWNAIKETKQVSRVVHTPLMVIVGDRKLQADTSTTPACLENGALGQDAVVCRVNGVPWDLSRPLERDSVVEFLPANSDEGLQTLWHSAAHVLGYAIEQCYPNANLCDGPALPVTPAGAGFYYDFQASTVTGAPVTVHPNDFTKLAKAAKTLIKRKSRFDRLVVSKSEALLVFESNPFKHELLQHVIPEGEQVTLYRCGDFIDLCRGPHIPHTGLLRGFSVLSTSAAQWRHKSSDFDRVSEVQRVYGIAFDSKEKLADWKHRREQAAKNDHRALGKAQKLFAFSSYSPGSPFFLPHGTRIYNKLVSFLRAEYRKRGYDEVRSPLIYDEALWKRSGHWDHYKEHMFAVSSADDSKQHVPAGPGQHQERLGLKPMNCPGHCVLFGMDLHSYRDLPVRLADFSSLHRNEDSGALTGLTRVRRFAQDDAHIFCRRDQMGEEVRSCLEFVKHVYSIFGFTFKLKLSTRPDSYVGELEAWDLAEAELTKALQDFDIDFELNPGDGAFYGPKIDISIRDALHREHQCATIQLDFQLPQKFDLSYKGEDGQFHRPVMIHRAVLGSMERMIAVLLETNGGKWPFWLSPRQCMVCTVAPEFSEYARDVCSRLEDAGIFADVDASEATLAKKVRQAQISQYNFIVVVGEKEQRSGSVTVRTRDLNATAVSSLEEFVSRLVALNMPQTEPAI